MPEGARLAKTGSPHSRQRQVGAENRCQVTGDRWQAVIVCGVYEAFEDHLVAPRGRGALQGSAYSGSAGGAPCGDLIQIRVQVDGDRVARAGFDASGCGAAQAAGSAVVELVEGRPLLDAARLT